MRPDLPEAGNVYRGRRPRWLVCAATLWLATAVDATAQSQQPEGTAEVLKRGQAALATAHPDEALALFERGYRDAPDRGAKHRFLFYRAVALQQQAEVNKRKEPLNDAVPLYREYLADNPQSGVALNNLARALEDLGQPAEAAECYKKAIALQDSRRFFYMENYARALSKAGDWAAASRVYRSLVKEQPMAQGPHAALMEHYLSADMKELPAYLWELLDAGQPERACLGALEALVRPGGRPIAGDRAYEFLTLVTMGLSRMAYEPAELTTLEAGRRLQQLSGAAGWSDCARQILELHSRAETPLRYGCWRHQKTSWPPRGVTATEGFQALIRAIGRRHRDRGDRARGLGEKAAAQEAAAHLSAAQEAFNTAAQYFHLSLDLNQGLGVDPVAFDELVRLEVGRDNVKAIAELADAYQRSLFESKAMAYAEGQDERIYQFHRALGEMYAVLGVWGKSSQVQSAVFQLEHARETSQKLEQRYGSQLPEEYRFSPEMADLLARSYEGAHRSSDGWKLRLEQAERYQQAGDRDAVQEILAPVWHATPPPELEQRFETLVKVSGAPSPEGPQAAVARDEEADRAKSAEALHVHRTKGAEIRFQAAATDDRVRLTANQREAVYLSLERFLAQVIASDAQSPSWLDAPAGVRSVRIDDKGRGMLTLEVEGRSVEVPFEVRSERTRPFVWERK